MNKIPTVRDLFDTDKTITKRLLENSHYGHRAILGLKDFLKAHIPTLGRDYEEISEGVFVARDALVDKNSTILGPTIICRGAEIRQGAFIRGVAVIGSGAVIGNGTEVKNSIIFDEAKLPHYNYVGDSIIGFGAHMGAGAIASNQRLDKRTVRIVSGDEIIDTGMRKLGAMLGDHSEIGANAVLSPGAVIGKEGLVYPLTHVRGTVRERAIFDGTGKERYRR